jgi:hypothetical protein
VGCLDDEACLHSDSLNRELHQTAIEHHAEHQSEGA